MDLCNVLELLLICDYVKWKHMKLLMILPAPVVLVPFAVKWFSSAPSNLSCWLHQEVVPT